MAVKQEWNHNIVEEAIERTTHNIYLKLNFTFHLTQIYHFIYFYVYLKKQVSTKEVYWREQINDYFNKKKHILSYFSVLSIIYIKNVTQNQANNSNKASLDPCVVMYRRWTFTGPWHCLWWVRWQVVWTAICVVLLG